MKPVASTMTAEGNLLGQEVEFSIGDPRWVMQSMSDLYSDRETACIREYSTNARDAHLAAGNDAPIEVTLPSSLNNRTFVVQDFGVGMSEDELKYHYTAFGASSKRDSDDFNGMLGFGCKSAVAYTNAFTVTAVKNGRKTIAVVTKKPDYSVVLKVIVSVDTIEPNGVRVEIPIHNVDTFVAKANDFYRFWKPGTVLVNGSEPKWAVGDHVGDDVYYSSDEHQSLVVMGNVPYRIANPRRFFPASFTTGGFVAYVPNGAVEFVPSREDLKYSDHTINTLRRVVNVLVANAADRAKSEMASAASHWEAYLVWRRWQEIMGSAVPPCSYRGETVSGRVKVKGFSWRPTGGRDTTRRVDTDIDLTAAAHCLFITGFNTTSLSGYQKSIVSRWRAHKSIGAARIYFVDSLDATWLPADRVVTWDRVKAEAPKKTTPGGGGKTKGVALSFDLVDKTGRQCDQPVPDKDATWLGVQEYRPLSGLSEVLAHYGLGPVVLVPANRRDKFLRDHPHIPSLRSVLTRLYEPDSNKLLSADAHAQRLLSGPDRAILKGLDTSRVDDPEIVSLAVLAAADYSAEHHRVRMNAGLGDIIGQTPKGLPVESWGWKTRKFPTAKYPLLTATVGKDDHFYWYLNAVHAAQKEKVT